jgi:hypothetical protein
MFAKSTPGGENKGMFTRTEAINEVVGDGIQEMLVAHGPGEGASDPRVYHNFHYALDVLAAYDCIAELSAQQNQVTRLVLPVGRIAVAYHKLYQTGSLYDEDFSAMAAVLAMTDHTPEDDEDRWNIDQNIILRVVQATQPGYDIKRLSREHLASHRLAKIVSDAVRSRYGMAPPAFLMRSVVHLKERFPGSDREPDAIREHALHELLELQSPFHSDIAGKLYPHQDANKTLLIEMAESGKIPLLRGAGATAQAQVYDPEGLQ